MTARWLLGLSLAACLVGVGRSAPPLSVLDLLNRYQAGEFDAIVSGLNGEVDFAELLEQLKRDAPAWIEAGGPAGRERRQLVAATFALEAARAGEWQEWKWIQRQPRMTNPVKPAEGYQPLNVLYWKPPPRLIEWGCQLMGQSDVPRPIERWWQLAALAVAQRSEDTAFLVGDPAIGLGVGAGEIGNLQDEIKHLDHVQKRFPSEARFMLAQGIARDRMWQADAIQAYLSVMKDPDVAGEAAMRLGVMSMRERRTGQAMDWFDRSETLTRDPYVVYLARYFKGQIAERDDAGKAQAAYRGAAAAWPRGQAATLALALNLFRDGKRTEAAELTSSMLDAVPPLFDPLREYVHADDRFWPYLIGRLRAEIVKPAGGGLKLAASEDSGDEAFAPQQQTFRTATDVVIVDVSVRDGGRVITGLTADDFVLTDNGVRQTVEAVDTAEVPIDVTVVVDVSGNTRRPWSPRTPRGAVVHEVSSQVGAVRMLLRPTDRIRALAIDSYVQQLLPLGSPTARPIPRFEFGGLASVYDTLAAAMMQPVEPGRRHVVIARTKGRDSIGAINAAGLASLAERPDALFHLVFMEQAMDTEDDLAAFQADPEKMGLGWPTHRFWLPHRRMLVGGHPHRLTPEGEIVKTALVAGGGSWHQTGLWNEPTLHGTFREAFENFRQSYVLRYSPRGVSRSGWHRIAVTVPKARGATVTARRGYGVEEPRPRAPVAPVPAVPATLAELTRAYGAGLYSNVVEGVRRTKDPGRLQSEFEDAGSPWPATPAVEAAFVVDLVEPGVFSPRLAVREQAEAILERYTKLIRHPFEPDLFERMWHYAVLSLLQGTVRASVSEAFAARAVARFPDEPRFALARAIAADQRSAASAGPTPRPGLRSPAATADLNKARELYEAILPFAEVAVETRIRLAYLLHRIGSDDEALARLTEAGVAPIADPALRYLHHLFRGQVLSSLGRVDEAIRAYRGAVAEAPTAQAARVALMNTLFRQGERREAEAIAEQIQKETATLGDPWWMYWQGHYRLFPQIAARLRQLAVTR